MKPHQEGSDLPKLFTIGYEGMVIDAFIDELLENNIEKLIDVRRMPISRKKGFSKNKLMKLVNINRIEYVNIREIGPPNSMRIELKKNLDYNKFFRLYGNYLNKMDDLLIELVDIASNKKTCLMCFEADATKCHRSVLALRVNKLSDNKFKIVNI